MLLYLYTLSDPQIFTCRRRIIRRLRVCIPLYVQKQRESDLTIFEVTPPVCHTHTHRRTHLIRVSLSVASSGPLSAFFRSKSFYCAKKGEKAVKREREGARLTRALDQFGSLRAAACTGRGKNVRRTRELYRAKV